MPQNVGPSFSFKRGLLLDIDVYLHEMLTKRTDLAIKENRSRNTWDGIIAYNYSHFGHGLDYLLPCS